MTLETLLRYNSFGMTPLLFSFLTLEEMGVVSLTNSDSYHLFYKEIIPHIRRFDHLKTKTLRRNQILILSEFIGLRHLEVGAIPFYHMDQFVNALSHIPQLEIFKYSNNFIDHYSALQLKFLFDLWSNTLHTLELSHNALSKRILVLTPVFPKLRRLQSLTISSNGIHKDGGIQLAKSLYSLSELKEIHMDNNQMGLGGIMFAPLIHHLPQLEIMNLSSNQLGPVGLRMFAKRIRFESESESELSSQRFSLSTLRCLDLSWNCLDSNPISISSSSFFSLQYLTSLNLSRNFMGVEGALSLSKCLLFLTQLQVLQLSSCKLKNEGFCLLSHCFSSLTNLRQMDLSSNEIDFRKKEIMMFIHSLHDLHQLEIIDVSKNRVPRDLIPLFQSILCRLSSLHTLKLLEDG